ncbi:hypothetical protein PVAP13_9NG454214 [Panicum virgatum]|uniref:Secreted protein n=1 Tax=Panicum virgatum TaxID=38727 RepID=A0A8T0MWP2_PANVG|nr:hypothetical protein PVAP13_9NG454214 [Panicum virgatum]
MAGRMFVSYCHILLLRVHCTPSKASVLEQASDVLWRRLFCFSWNGYHHLSVSVPEQCLFVSNQCSVVNAYSSCTHFLVLCLSLA